MPLPSKYLRNPAIVIICTSTELILSHNLLFPVLFQQQSATALLYPAAPPVCPQTSIRIEKQQVGWENLSQISNTKKQAASKNRPSHVTHLLKTQNWLRVSPHVTTTLLLQACTPLSAAPALTSRASLPPNSSSSTCSSCTTTYPVNRPVTSALLRVVRCHTVEIHLQKLLFKYNHLSETSLAAMGKDNPHSNPILIHSPHRFSPHSCDTIYIPLIYFSYYPLLPLTHIIKNSSLGPAQ